MPNSQFSTHYPLASLQLERIRRGAPDEIYSKRNKAQGREKAFGLLIQELVITPFKLPFYIGFNLALVVYKTARVSSLIFLIAQKKPGAEQRMKDACFETLDYLMLIPLLPAAQLSRLTRLFFASVLDCRIYYKPLKTFPDAIQVEYYERRVFSIMDRFATYRELDTEVKASLHGLQEHFYAQLEAKKGDREKKEFLLQIIPEVKALCLVIRKQKVDALLAG